MQPRQNTGQMALFHALVEALWAKLDGGMWHSVVQTWSLFGKLAHPGAFGMALCLQSRAGSHGGGQFEDAGFTACHPTILQRVYASGFPKATRIDTQVDRRAGAVREVVGSRKLSGKARVLKGGNYNGIYGDKDRLDAINLTTPATEMGQAWEGHRYGLQAVKPALEPIIVFQKPYSGRPIDCIVRTGAGGINIHAGRIEIQTTDDYGRSNASGNGFANKGDFFKGLESNAESAEYASSSGRWPANFYLQHDPRCCDDDCTEYCPVARLDAQRGN